MTCPYCGGKNTYPLPQTDGKKYGCRDCEKEIEHMRGMGMSADKIKRLFEGRKRARKEKGI